MEKTMVAVLTGYFNTGDGKRSNAEWVQELKVLSPDEKRELAMGVCAITGDTIK